jgi:hypothetical protein
MMHCGLVEHILAIIKPIHIQQAEKETFMARIGLRLGYLHCQIVSPTDSEICFSPSQGIGDSGQGVANGILFVLFTKKARERFICCWRHCRRRKLGETPGETTDLMDANRRQRINSASYLDNTYTPSYSPRTSPSH